MLQSNLFGTKAREEEYWTYHKLPEIIRSFSVSLARSDLDIAQRAGAHRPGLDPPDCCTFPHTARSGNRSVKKRFVKEEKSGLREETKMDVGQAEIRT